MSACLCLYVRVCACVCVCVFVMNILHVQLVCFVVVKCFLLVQLVCFVVVKCLQIIMSFIYHDSILLASQLDVCAINSCYYCLYDI